MDINPCGKPGRGYEGTRKDGVYNLETAIKPVRQPFYGKA